MPEIETQIVVGQVMLGPPHGSAQIVPSTTMGAGAAPFAVTVQSNGGGPAS
jgi:hypothetical protein